MSSLNHEFNYHRDDEDSSEDSDPLMLNSRSPLSVIFMPSLEGRSAPVAGGTMRSTQPINNNSIFVTPSLPFERNEIKIKKPVPIPRPAIFEETDNLMPPRQDDTTFAIRFKNSTWAHSVPNTHDHFVTREEAAEVEENYRREIANIPGFSNLDKAYQLQGRTDILLGKLSDQLNVECSERKNILELARESYSTVFNLLEEELNKTKNEKEELQKQNKDIEKNMSSVIDNSTLKVNEAREDCAKQIAEMNKKIEDMKDKYDSSMKSLVEQKAQLDEHVKALHRVFLEFQSDSVYMTLEELKQKQESLQTKVNNKETEILKYKRQIKNLQSIINKKDNEYKLLETENNLLKKDLADANRKNNRLNRMVDLQEMEANPDDDKEEEEESLMKEVDKIRSENAGDKVDDESEHQVRRVRRRIKSTIDPTIFIHVNQKLIRVYDTMVDILQRTNNPIPPTNEQAVSDEINSLISSCDYSLMIRAIEKRADECIQISDRIENIDITGGADQPEVDISNEPRFIQYVKSFNIEQADKRSNMNVFAAIRELFQAKYTSDKWQKRMGKQPLRFPEFVIEYYCKDGETIFTALQRAARLYRNLYVTKNAETKLFKKFLLESYTVDELSFFLWIRYLLVGLPNVPADAPQLLNVPFAKCKEVLEKVVGVYSPALPPMMKEAENLVFSDYIDYASFITILLRHYRGERRKRRNAVTLMFKSKKYSQSSYAVDFSSFVSIIQSLGYQGPVDNILDLYREASLLGRGMISLDSLLHAMDNLSLHFYTIETPLATTTTNNITEMNRKDITTHWVRFGSWFKAYRKPFEGKFEPWLRSMISERVRTVDSLFKACKSVDTLYTEYRSLLDAYQFALDVVIRGKSRPLSARKSERIFLLLENLIDLMLTTILEEDNKVPDLTNVF